MQADKRLTALAENILSKSLKVKKGEKVYLESFGSSTKELLNEMIKVTVKLGATPFYFFNDSDFIKSLINGAKKEQIESFTAFHKHLMESVDCYVGLRGNDDLFALADVDEKFRSLYNKIFHEQVHMRTRLPKTRWCVMRYPNITMAAMSRMSLKQFEDFYFNACLLDYQKMGKAMLPLKKLMDKTDKVHIKGKIPI